MNDMSPPVLGPMREPPQNLQVEQVVLGTVLANDRAYHQISDLLLEHHFTGEAHREIWRALVRRLEAGQVADAIHIWSDLEGSGLITGGMPYLASLLSANMGLLTVRQYAVTLRDLWHAREIIKLSGNAVDLAYQPPERSDTSPGRAAAEALEAGLLALAEAIDDETPAVPLGQAVTLAVAKGRENFARGAANNGISTGYPSLDRKLGGLVDGDLILLAARPSMGKTGLGFAIAIRAAAALRDKPDAEHRRVLFWSGEMAADQLGARAAAAGAWLSVASVFTHRQLPLPDDRDDRRLPPELEDWQIKDLFRAEQEAWTVPISIDDRPGITVPRLRARARRMRRAVRQGGLALLVIDYVGLMRASAEATRQNKVTEISEISAGLKALARELSIPVVALSQLNRAVESREDKTPQMSDLRDSGALEQDADKIMFLHRSHYYLSRSMPKRNAKETEVAFGERISNWEDAMAGTVGQADVIVAKNRQGATGQVDLHFHDQSVWFRDKSESQDGTAWPAARNIQPAPAGE